MASKGGGKIGGGGLYVSAKEFAMIGTTRDAFLQKAPSTEDQDQLLKELYRTQGIFLDQKEIKAYLGQEAFQQTLTKGEMKAIGSYTGGNTKSINTGLVNQYKQGSKELPPKKETMILNIDRALQKLPGWKGVVNRAIDIHPFEFDRFLSAYKPGRTVTFPAYTSTTSERFSIFSGNVKMQIHSKGRRGKTIFNLSKHAAEEEVLFARGSKFRVGKVIEGYKSARIVLYEI